MSTPIFQILYLSSARPELTEDELLKILYESQQRNSERGITGLLLHSDGNIIQVIEGEKTAVESLFEKIERDTRHHQIMVLSRKFVEQRDFPEYKMGFKLATTEQLSQDLPGFSKIVENRELPQATLEGLSKHVSIFLKTFAYTTRIEHSFK
jgi:acylphosphatase